MTDQTDINANGTVPLRQWSTIKLSTGFYLAELLLAVKKFADSDERVAAIQRVQDLIKSHSTDAQEWREASEVLGALCQAHPDAWKESGTWYNGDPCILAMACAKAVADACLYKIYPSLQLGVEDHVFRALKYMLRASVQTPDSAVNCLKWLEYSLHRQGSR